MAQISTKIKLYLKANSKTWDRNKVSLQDNSDGNGAFISFWDYNIAQPTAEQLDSYEIAALQLQTDYDSKQYQRDRVYPSIGDQLDMQYKDLLNGTTTWKDAVAKVKSDNPKN